MIKHLKRIQKDIKETQAPSHYAFVQPLKHDLLTWHFTFLGPEDTEFAGGIYHGYFKLPHDFPMSPPDIYYLTESGRYTPNTKICLTVTSYHKEEWSPAWTMRTLVEAVNAYFLVDGDGIGSERVDAEERRRLAEKSRGFVCEHCGEVREIEKRIVGARKTGN